ncbi:uncharacterized protein LOC142325008 isoform X2 [Lycorma delicatula]|uniref:uncharacterized protein LOC142325008 isoform X2 n=1 Tax=Lycorma delicatula TaxID=130591 RepID=UPI003F519ADC
MDIEEEEQHNIIPENIVIQKTKKSPLKTYSRLSNQQKNNATALTIQEKIKKISMFQAVNSSEEDDPVAVTDSPPVRRRTSPRNAFTSIKEEPANKNDKATIDATNTVQQNQNLPYKCEKCPRTFSSVGGFKRHMQCCKFNPVEQNNENNNHENSLDITITNKKSASEELQECIMNLINETDGINTAAELVTPEDIKPPPIASSESSSSFHPLQLEAVGPGKCHCCGEDLETAHSGGEFECVDCNKLFKLKSSLERHRRVIHNEGETFDCPECGARCPDKGTLARHMYTHTGLKPYSCPICKKEFSRKYHLVRHNMQTGCDGSQRATFPCQVCGRIFNRKDNLREHLRAHAGQTKRKKIYNCEHCNKEFFGTTLLHIHKRTHTGERPYQCDMCEKRFPSSGAMKKHRRKHTGERPYECKECFARFAAKETLNRHMRTHTGIKPHSCQFCGKSFIQASQLRAHIFHHSGENGFTCEQCGKAFNRRTRLQLHIKYVHEGAKPFTCDQCGKPFVRKEDLARHQILHTGIKAHKCPICEKCFAMKSSLKIHLLTHTKEPPRSCDECGRAFIRQDCLLRHMRTKHRDMLEEIMAEAEKKKLQQQLLAAADAAIDSPDPDEPNNMMSEEALASAIRELLTLLVDETTLKAFGWPEASVDHLLEAVIKRCGHQPAGFPDMPCSDKLRENAKLLFTVVIDDSAVKTLLNNQTVDEVILHVLRLAKS